MKKILLLCAVLCTSALSAFAAEKAIENTFSDATFSKKVNNYTSTWTNNSGTALAMFAFNNGSNDNQWTEVRCGRKAAASTPTITTENALAETIAKVVINFSQANAAMVKEAYLQVAADTASFAAAAKIAFTVAAGEVVIPIATPAANQCYRITMDLDKDGTNNGTIRINAVNFVYNVADVPATGISIQEGDEIDLEILSEVQLHAVLTPADATTTVTWASSDPTAVSVSTTGLVKALEMNNDGFATITATAGTHKASIDVYLSEPKIVTPPTNLDIPEGTLTVSEARTICAGLASGTTTGTKYYVKGWIKKIHNNHASGVSGYGNGQFYMSENKYESGIYDEADFMAYQVYYLEGAEFKQADQVQEGDYVVVYGELTNYNGTYETVGKGAAYIHSTNNVRIPADPVEKGEISIADFLEAKDEINIYTLTGKVSDIAMDKEDATKYSVYGNFNITDETGTIYIYGLLTADGEKQQFQTMGIDNGDIVTLKGTYTIYNGKPQIQDAIYVSHVEGSTTALENTTANEVKARKVVENGQIYILKDGVKYNIFGAEVK